MSNSDFEDLVPSPQSTVSKMPGRRAQAMADGSLWEYLAFRLGDEFYALALGDVREILPTPQMTLVPRAPREVLGIISVRGTLVTVMDLRRKLALPAAPPTRRNRVLLVPGEESEIIGLYVDEVLQVVRFSEAQVEGATNVLGGNMADYVAGIARQDGRIVILLNLSQLLGN